MGTVFRMTREVLVKRGRPAVTDVTSQYCVMWYLNGLMSVLMKSATADTCWVVPVRITGALVRIFVTKADGPARAICKASVITL